MTNRKSKASTHPSRPAPITLVTAGIAVATLLLTSCTPGERGAVVGGTTGAAIGALAGGDGDRSTGALIGGAVGAVAGSEISKNRAYRNSGY